MIAYQANRTARPPFGGPQHNHLILTSTSPKRAGSPLLEAANGSALSRSPPGKTPAVENRCPCSNGSRPNSFSTRNGGSRVRWRSIRHSMSTRQLIASRRRISAACRAEYLAAFQAAGVAVVRGVRG